MEVSANPSGRFNAVLQRFNDRRALTSAHFDAGEDRIVFRTIANDDVVLSRVEFLAKLAIVRVINILHSMLTAGRTEVRRLSPVSAMKRHFARSRSILFAADIDIDPTSLRKLYVVFS